jgi:tetratricopeptide (TPR) repeat protein
MVNATAMIRTPAELNARWQSSLAAEKQGDFRVAEAGYRAILQVAPKHPAALRRLAGIGRRYGDQDTARALLERAVTADANYGPAKLDLADILQSAGDLERAAGLYADGIALNAASPPQLSNYAACLLKLKRFEAALGVAERHRATGAQSANVAAYRAQALWELGKDDAALALFDPAKFVFSSRPAAPDGFADIAEFNSQLVKEFETHPTLTDKWDPTQRAARGGRVTENLFGVGIATPQAIAAFRSMIADTVENIARGLTNTPGHPFLGRRAKQPLEVVSWANLMPGQGVQAPHIHNLGWLSGVYYPKAPAAISSADDAHAGWLGFGRPGYDIPSVRPPPTRFLAPEEGLLVCFPSYIWHWTEPFEGDEERVSVAFDVA